MPSNNDISIRIGTIEFDPNDTITGTIPDDLLDVIAVLTTEDRHIYVSSCKVKTPAQEKVFLEWVQAYLRDELPKAPWGKSAAEIDHLCSVLHWNRQSSRGSIMGCF